VIELAFLVGLKQQEIADALAINVRTVERDLRFAKAWLREQLAP
jgi:DNA-directed RNA polymerase specialized sigma24 family protein